MKWFLMDIPEGIVTFIPENQIKRISFHTDKEGNYTKMIIFTIDGNIYQRDKCQDAFYDMQRFLNKPEAELTVEDTSLQDKSSDAMGRALFNSFVY